MNLAQVKGFISIWYESTTQVEVETRTGMDRRALQNHVAYLRRNGIELDNLPSGRKHKGIKVDDRLGKNDWEELRRWAKACQTACEIRMRYRNE